MFTCKSLGVSAAILATSVISYTQHPALAIIPPVAYGFYKVINKSMGKQPEEKIIPNPHRLNPNPDLNWLNLDSIQNPEYFNSDRDSLDSNVPNVEERAYQELCDNRLAKLLNYNEEGKLLQVPSNIKAGLASGIQNQNLSCAIASFLYIFVATEHFDGSLLVDQEGDSRDAKEIRALLRDIVNDLRGQDQYVEGDKLLALRLKVMPRHTDHKVLDVMDFWDNLVEKLNLNTQEFSTIYFSGESKNTQEIVETYLKELSNNEQAEFIDNLDKKQTIFIDIPRANYDTRCDILNEIDFLGQKYTLRSVIGYVPDRKHEISWVIKNKNAYLFDSQCYVDEDSGTAIPSVKALGAVNPKEYSKILEQSTFLIYSKI